MSFITGIFQEILVCMYLKTLKSLLFLGNIPLTFSQNTSFTFCSSINAQKIFPKLLFCDFQKLWKIFQRAKRHEKMVSSPLGAGEKHFLIRELKHWKSVEFNSPKLGS